MADTGSGKNIGKVLQRKVFRTREKVLQNLGKADKTTDDVFEQHVLSFNEQQNASSRLQKELKHYLTCVKEMSAASQSMYRTIKEVYEAEWTGFTEVTSAVEQLAILWDDYVNKLSNELQVSLGGYVGQFPDMKAKISKRNRKLTDFDCARHNYEAASKKQDEVKTNKAKEEMVEAKQVYEIMNEELNNELPALYSSRVGFMASYVNTLCTFEATFQHESAKLKDTMADVSEKLGREAASSGKPFVSLQRNVESPRNSSISMMPSTSRDDRSAVRLNNAPASSTPDDEAWVTSPSTASPRSNILPQFQRAVSKEDDKSADSPVPKVNNGSLAEQRPALMEKPSSSNRSSQNASPGARLSSQDATNGSKIDNVTVVDDSTVNGGLDDDSKADTEVVYSVPKSYETIELVPEDRVLFRVVTTHPYVGEDIDELTFEAGEIITVVPFDDPEEQDEGWLMGVKEDTRQKGVFPENFTRRI